MVGSRTTSTSFDNALDDQVIHVGLLLSIEWSGGVAYTWTGYGDMVYDSNTYVGIGELGSISPIEETADSIAKGCSLTLTGLKPSQVSLALAQARQGSLVAMHLALFDAAGTLIDVHEDVFTGLMDVPTIRKGKDAGQIQITVESPLIRLEQSNERRYTNEDQQELFPNDVGLEFVAGLQDKAIRWGGDASST